MRAFQRVVFIIGMFWLLTQTVRHIYVRIEDRTSVLDQFNKTPTDDEVGKAKSLDELIAKYGPLKKQADTIRDEIDDAVIGLKDEARQDKDTELRKKYKKEIDDEEKYRNGINHWESNAKTIFELRAFWLLGMVLVVIGAIFYCKGAKWLGLAFVVPGFAEMIYWTSPTLRSFGLTADLEFNRLLNNKIAFSLAALVAIVVFWQVAMRMEERERKLEQQ
jgi:hypothetical protein